MTVLERLVAAGISEDTAHEEIASGYVHVDGVQVLDPATPADKPAVIVLRSPTEPAASGPAGSVPSQA